MTPCCPSPSRRRRSLRPLARTLVAALGIAGAAAAHAQFHRGPGWHHGPWPRYGVVVGVLPPVATLVTVGAVGYWYVDGWYYRRVPAGYEVVPPPAPAPAREDRLFIYPKNRQGPDQQVSDEYECHRWAADQSRFDPTAAAAGQATDEARRGEYRRAQTACLEGRGYTVR